MTAVMLLRAVEPRQLNPRRVINILRVVVSKPQPSFTVSRHDPNREGQHHTMFFALLLWANKNSSEP
ncbi:MAG: hypothetical protein ACK56I_16030, partial [bacterium]